MKEISRREFLKLGAILAGGALLSGCLPENSQASLPPQGETPKEPTPTPTKTNTPEAAKTLTPTKVPTPAPTERPTLSPEELTKERMARWEGRLWTIGSSDSAGGREIDPYDEEMQIFKEEVTLMAEKSGVKAEAVEMLLIGNNADIKERKDGTIEQIAPTKFFGIMISGKEEASVFCFTKDASGMEMDSSCDWFKKGEIWGSEYGEYIVKSPEGIALEPFIIKEGEEGLTVFKATPDNFGVLSIIEQEVKGELEKDENGEWVITGVVEPKAGEEAVTGILITGENNGEAGTFFLECKTLPLDRKLKEEILPETPDLALGRVYLSEKGIRYGYLDLKDGSWNGNSLYENIESILKEKGPIEEILQLPGLKIIWNEEKERFDYIDVYGKASAYWDSEQKRIVIDVPWEDYYVNSPEKNILDWLTITPENASLIHPLSPKEVDELMEKSPNAMPVVLFDTRTTKGWKVQIINFKEPEYGNTTNENIIAVTVPSRTEILAPFDCWIPISRGPTVKVFTFTTDINKQGLQIRYNESGEIDRSKVNQEVVTGEVAFATTPNTGTLDNYVGKEFKCIKEPVTFFIFIAEGKIPLTDAQGRLVSVLPRGN